ncbi:MAG: hypothetical protein HOP07_14920 [Bacteriovoracaceae bacterium]|nr:hypothetical protein [Bacteriovoracaceae bacterium]
MGEDCIFASQFLQAVKHDSYQYSVPERFVGAILKAIISVDEIILFSGDEKIYEHQRFYYEKIDALIFEHYLDQLSRKPGPLFQESCRFKF